MPQEPVHAGAHGVPQIREGERGRGGCHLLVGLAGLPSRRLHQGVHRHHVLGLAVHQRVALGQEVVPKAIVAPAFEACPWGQASWR